MEPTSTVACIAPSIGMKMICCTCRREVRLIPIDNRSSLYKSGFNLSKLIEFILHDHSFFLCQQCCKVFSQECVECIDCIQRFKCFVCGRPSINPASIINNVGSTLSGYEKPCIMTKKHVCVKCVALLVELSTFYKSFFQQKFDYQEFLASSTQITSYLCAIKTDPSVIHKTLQLYTYYHPMQSINVTLIDHLMKPSAIYKRGLAFIQSTPYFMSVVTDLRTKRVVFQLLSEVTKYVKIKFNVNPSYTKHEEDENRRKSLLVQKYLKSNVVTQNVGVQHSNNELQHNSNDDFEWDFSDDGDPCCSFW